MRSSWASSLSLARLIHKSSGFQLQVSLERATRNPSPTFSTLTLVLADVSEKAVAQVKRGAVELLTPRLDQSAAETIAEKLTGGYWTHDYALTATEAKALGLPVKVGMPVQIMEFMKLYPQPIQQSGIEYLPIDPARRRRG